MRKSMFLTFSNAILAPLSRVQITNSGFMMAPFPAAVPGRLSDVARTPANLGKRSDVFGSSSHFCYRSVAMEIAIYSLLDGATRATGAVAVIDVFRAFTTAAVALANGATSIVMVRSVEEAMALRDVGIGQICMGEIQGRAPLGFDFGNSPFEISTVNFHGKTIIQRTSAGTQGIVAASRAKRLYAASLVTAEATVRALLFGFTR
jgi:hypothetical protein